MSIAIAPAIADAERHGAMRKLPDNLDACAAYQRGLWHLGKVNADDTGLANILFHRAIDLHPSFAGGYSGLATVHLVGSYGFQSGTLADAQSSAESLARRAVALDSTDAEARSCLSWALWRRGDCAGALAEAERALAMTPNLASAHGRLGATLIQSGRPQDGLAFLETCIKLDPRDPLLALRLNHVMIGLYYSREYAAAAEAAKCAIRSYPDYLPSYRWLAAALGQTERGEEANEALQKAIAVSPAWFNTYIHRRMPCMRPEDHAHMLEGLRKASGLSHPFRRGFGRISAAPGSHRPTPRLLAIVSAELERGIAQLGVVIGQIKQIEAAPPADDAAHERSRGNRVVRRRFF